MNVIGVVLDNVAGARRPTDDFTSAVEIFGHLGDRHLESRTRHNIAVSLAMSGRYAEAVEVFTHELEASREFGDRDAEARRLYSIGMCLKEMGKHQQALHRFEASLDISREFGHLLDSAGTLSEIANG